MAVKVTGVQKGTPAQKLGLSGCTLLSIDGNEINDMLDYEFYSQGPVLELKEQYGLTEGSRYLFYTRGGGVDTWTLRYIARYVLNTDTLDFWEYEDQEYTWNELYSSYDYIILYSPDEYIEDFFRQQGFDPAQGYAHLVIDG